MVTPVYKEQIGQMVASFGFAKLVGEPELTEVAEGLHAYVADADLQFPAGRPVQVTIWPLAKGFSLPYRKGDMVRVVYNHGEAVVVGHVATSDEHDGNTTIQPREGKDVRLGGGSGEWEPLMLYEAAAQDLARTRSMLGELAARVSDLMNAAAPGTGTTWTTDPTTGFDVSLNEMGTGDPAARLKARK